MGTIDFPPRKGAPDNHEGKNTESPDVRPAHEPEVLEAAEARRSVGDTKAEQRMALRREVEEVEALSPEEKKVARNEKLARQAGMLEVRKAAEESLKLRHQALKDFIPAQKAFKKNKQPTAEEQMKFQLQKARFENADRQTKEDQLAYAKVMQGSVKERISVKTKAHIRTRLSQKNGIPEDEVSQETIDAEAAKVQARYNRMIRTREITIPLANQENKVREELLDEKGRNIFQKGLKFYREKNQQVEDAVAERLVGKKFMGIGKKLTEAQAKRHSKLAVRAARVVSFAALGAGAGFVAGGAAAVAAGGHAVWKLSRFVMGSTAGLIHGKAFAETTGKERNAEYEAMQHVDITSIDDLDAQQKSFKTGSAEAVEAARQKRENLTALFLSLGLSADAAIQAGGLEAVGNAAKHLFGVPDAEAQAQELADVPHVGAPVMPQAVVEAPEAPQTPEVPVEKMEIGGKINNADRLFGHFRDQLLKNHAGDAKRSAALEKLFSLSKSQDRLTNELGFQDLEKGLSAMMHKGDSLSFENDSIVFRTADGHWQRVIDAQGHIHKLDPAKFVGGVTHRGEHIPHTGVHHPHTGVHHPHTKVDEAISIPRSTNALDDEYPGMTPDDAAPGGPVTDDTRLPKAALDETVSRVQGPTAQPNAPATLGRPLGEPGDDGSQAASYTPSSARGSGTGIKTLGTPLGEEKPMGSDVPNAPSAPRTSDMLDTQIRLGMTPFVESSDAAKAGALQHPGTTVAFVKKGLFTSYVAGWRVSPSGKLELVNKVMGLDGKPMSVPRDTIR